MDESFTVDPLDMSIEVEKETTSTSIISQDMLRQNIRRLKYLQHRRLKYLQYVSLLWEGYKSRSGVKTHNQFLLNS